MHRPPNILLIILDDLCWGDLACNGNPFVQTPCLDQLAAESCSGHAHRSGPLCTPARASLMTGRYHLRTKAIDTYCGRSIVDPTEPMLPRYLQGAGYTTGLFGKWHLGDTHPSRPIDCGFDVSVTHRGGGLGQPGDLPANARRGGQAYYDPWLERNGIPEQVSGYCTDIFADETIAFIHNNHEQPFFAMLATNAPHSPLVVPEQWSEPYRELGETWSHLYGMVTNIDFNIGRVLQALDDCGLREQTIVVFTSDHGPCPSARDRSRPLGEQTRWNAGLRGEKGSLYEGGIRVPCLWRWPDEIPAGTLSVNTHVMDLMPTLLSAAKVTYGDEIDGQDLLPALRGSTQEQVRLHERILGFQWHRGDEPVIGRNGAIIHGEWKWYRPREHHPAELYNLDVDPSEQQDVAAEHPEQCATYARAYATWFDAMCQTRSEPFSPVPLSVGHPDAATTMLTRQDWRMVGCDGWNDNTDAFWWIQVFRAGCYAISVDLATASPVPTMMVVSTQHGSLRIPLAHGALSGQGVLMLPQGCYGIEAAIDRDRERLRPLALTVCALPN
jgi:arylsulfatase A-like enzyme